MAELKKACQQVNTWFKKNTFQYEIPYCLTAPYCNEEVFLSILNTNIGIISSRPLGIYYKQIKLYYFDKNDNITYEIIDFIAYNLKIQLNKDQFESIFTFNQNLQLHLFGLPQQMKYLQDINMIKNGGNRNYLFVPIIIQENIINYQLINEFNQQNGNIEKSISLTNLISNDDDILYKNLYYLQNNHTINCIYHIMRDPQNTSVKQYFDFISQYSSYTVESLQHYYCLKNEEMDFPVSNFLYDHQFQVNSEKLNSILQLRSIQNNNNHKNVESLVFFKQINSIHKITYYSYEQIHTLPKHSQQHQTCKQTFEISSLSNHILPISSFYLYPFNIQQYNEYLKLHPIMLQLEQILIVSEFSLSIGIYPSQTLQNAITRPSFNKEYNYELYETLGDSILKFFGTLYVFLGPQNTNENNLSYDRSLIVKNDFIGKHLFENQYFGLFNYVRSLNNQTKWHGTVLQNLYSSFTQPQILKQSGAKLIVGTIADIFESLIAAVYLHKYSLFDVHQFLLNVKHPVSSYPINQLFFPQQSLLLDYPFENFNNQMTFKNLINPIIPPQQNIQNNLELLYEYLQTTVIEYKFQNKYILYEAFHTSGKNMDIDLPVEIYYQYLQRIQIHSTRGHQLLELLGDSILECFVMCNCFPLIKSKFTPTDLYRVKMCLLSNSFLAKIAINYNINYFLKEKSIQTFIQEVDLEEKFTKYNGNFVKIPKILSDTFEALVGAIFMDGGWSPVLQFLKKVYFKFIPFVCLYIGEIDGHVVDRIHQYSIRKQGHFDMRSRKTQDNKFCYEIWIGNEIIAKYSDNYNFNKLCRESTFLYLINQIIIKLFIIQYIKCGFKYCESIIYIFFQNIQIILSKLKLNDSIIIHY